jgi:non-ribosomal peptide synthetase component F
VLLRHLTKRDDIVVGTDVANRNHLETEGVIGFFINQLVLRTDLSGDPSFRELLRTVRKTAWAAYTHQELPFDRLVEALNPERSLRHSPLFQVKFVFQDSRRAEAEAPGADEEASGLRLTGLPAEGVTAKFDLTLNANRRPDALVYWIEYKTSLFKPSTVERFAELYEALLSQVVARPEGRLSELEESIVEADRRRRARREKELKEARHNKIRGLTRKTAAGTTRPGRDAL